MAVSVYAGKRYFINTTAFISACNYMVNFKQLNEMGVADKKNPKLIMNATTDQLH